jgi:hypothetical protein
MYIIDIYCAHTDDIPELKMKFCMQAKEVEHSLRLKLFPLNVWMKLMDFYAVTLTICLGYVRNFAAIQYYSVLKHFKIKYII